MTTTSSMQKMAAVRATSPATAVARSSVCVFSITEPGSASVTVGRARGCSAPGGAPLARGAAAGRRERARPATARVAERGREPPYPTLASGATCASCGCARRPAARRPARARAPARRPPPAPPPTACASSLARRPAQPLRWPAGVGRQAALRPPRRPARGRRRPRRARASCAARRASAP